MHPDKIEEILRENQVLKKEIRVAREAAEITADLVVKQFQETERVLRRFRDANAQRKAVLNSASRVSIVAADVNGTITVFNTGAENLLGYKAGEVIGKASLHDFHTRTEISEAVRELSSQCGKPVTEKEFFFMAGREWPSQLREWTYVKKNKDRFPVEMSINLLLESDYTLSGVLCIAMDISENKMAAKAQLESEQKYRSLFDANPNPIFVLSPATLEILDVNSRAEEAYGYSRDELIGRAFVDFGEMEADHEHFRMIRENEFQQCIKNLKVRQFRKGKKPFFVNFTTCPIDYHGQEAVVLTVDDITEMIEKDALLIQAGKMTILGEMSAGVAHELNQPLNAIKLGNEFLKLMADRNESVSPEDLKEVSEEVSAQVDRAAGIINRLRAFGRKTDFEKEHVDLNEPVRNVLGMIGAQLELENITVQLDLDRNLPRVSALENRLEQVLFNLVTNARDAIDGRRHQEKTDFKGVITIRSFVNGRMASVSVTDNGMGMSDEVRERVFEPFFTTKEVGKGMGLGLSIIYGIIRDYNGCIEVKSREGRGSEFVFSFPLEGA